MPDFRSSKRLLLKVNQSLADVAKLVDARDLKSLDLGHTGSIPVVRTSRSPTAGRNSQRSGRRWGMGVVMGVMAMPVFEAPARRD